MILSFFELKNYDFSLSDIHVLLKMPLYRTLNVRSRNVNGFLYITKGECTYSFREGSFTLSPGSLVYLPLASRHYLRITSEEFAFYQLSFTLKIDGESVLFSDGPLKLTSNVSPECAEAIKALSDECRFDNNSIVKTEKLCAIFSSLQKSVPDPLLQRLHPAVHYIHEHMNKSVDCRHLASLCFLSTAQFYSLFHKKFGITPLEYRNRLLIKHAGLLFQTEDYSVTEVAALLGFDNPAYFSRFFKKETGFSPREYIKRQTEK